MTPEQRAKRMDERIRLAVAGAPPLPAETIAALRQLLPPVPAAVRASRMELAA